jgi:hypothetical protein
MKFILEFTQFSGLNNQSPDTLGVNSPGYGQGAHVGNWGPNYGKDSNTVRSTFGEKGDKESTHLPQQKKGIEVPNGVYDPTQDRILLQDEISDLLNQYNIKCKQNSEEAQEFKTIDSKVVEFIRNYINDN